MVVLSMSYKEIYDGLEADISKLHYQRDKLLPVISKEFRSEKRFPNYKWIEYKPSSGNNYLILYCAQNSLQIDTPLVRYCALIWDDNYRFVITWMKGDYKHSPLHQFESTPIIHAYTNHFFDQYKKRFLKDDSLSSNDVVARFLMRNYTYTPIEINDSINRNISSKDDSYKRGFSIEDGFCFTKFDMDGDFHDIDDIGKDEVYAICFLYTTYMNKDGMSSEQKEAIKEEEEKAWASFFRRRGIL